MTNKEKLSLFAETLLERLLKELKPVNNPNSFHASSQLPFIGGGNGNAAPSFHSDHDNDYIREKKQENKEIVSPVMQYIKKTSIIFLP